MKGRQPMHRTIPRKTGISPKTGGNEIMGSETNEPQLQFVVTYREAAKAQAKGF
jgi:hypothetical protein